MRAEQTVNEMAQEVLSRQARALASEPENRSSRRWGRRRDPGRYAA
jgi:hypothetical protein